MPRPFRPLLLVFVPLLPAASHADDAWVQSFMKGFVDGCVRRGLERKHNPEYVKSFCNCSADVMRTNLTESEMKELDAASPNKPSAASETAMKKVQDKMALCKTKDGLQP